MPQIAPTGQLRGKTMPMKATTGFAIATLLGVLAVGATADEIEALRRRDREWVEAIARKDLGAIEHLYAEDAHFLPTGAPRVQGRARIRDSWRAMLEDPGFRSLSFAPVEIAVAKSGELAYDVGDYELRSVRGGAEVVEKGKYVVVWKNIGGTWQVAADIFNPNEPLR
jgi:ketosteroid isomerase-like protein